MSESNLEVYENFIWEARWHLHAEYFDLDETNEEMKVSLLSRHVNSFIIVMLHSKNKNQTIFRFRCHDIYPAGFAMFDQKLKKFCWYEFRNTTHNIAHSTFLPCGENYQHMQSYAGTTLTELTVGHSQLHNLVFTLNTSPWNDKIVGKNLLVICVMILESIRFKALFKTILACFGSGYRLTGDDHDLITSWSKISKLLTAGEPSW